MACLETIAYERNENETMTRRKTKSNKKGRVGERGGRKPMEQDEMERNEEGTWEKEETNLWMQTSQQQKTLLWSKLQWGLGVRVDGTL